MKKYTVIVFFVLCPSWVLALNIHGTIDEFEKIEQHVFISGSFNKIEAQKLLRKKVNTRMHDLVRPFFSEFKKNNFLDKNSFSLDSDHQIKNNIDIPEDWNFKSSSFKGKKNWLERINGMSPISRCYHVKLSYLYAIWITDTSAPNAKIERIQDVRLEEGASSEKKQNFDIDAKKATFAFRFIKSVPAKLIPENCKLSFNRSIFQTVNLRYEMIYNDINRHVPLGSAIGMCGRPMNSHYVDFLPNHLGQKTIQSYKELTKYWKDNTQVHYNIRVDFFHNSSKFDSMFDKTYRTFP